MAMNDIEADKQIGEIEQQGVEARTFFDDYLSDQLIFRRASGKVVRKSEPDGFLEGPGGRSGVPSHTVKSKKSVTIFADRIAVPT